MPSLFRLYSPNTTHQVSFQCSPPCVLGDGVHTPSACMPTASQQWRSALTKDSFLELGPVKEALRDSKVLGGGGHTRVTKWKFNCFT